jgi:hypothetical protein
LSAAASKDYERCPHKVPKEVCTRCNPQLTAKFKAAKDWCGEHNVPESQCFKCHPDLTFDPLPPLKEGADGKSGKRVATVEGFDLGKLDKAIADAESE